MFTYYILPIHSGGGGATYTKPANECIEESNKGHQMLMKMGWAGSGTGLGSHGQGIDKPISGGEVRDRQDQFKVNTKIHTMLIIRHIH